MSGDCVGEYTDPTGLIYLRARYYDPATGQFLTIDPMVGDTKTPYSYVDGNPLNATDPSGLCGIFGSGPCPGANALYDVLTHGPGKAVAGAAVNIGRGATGGLTDKIANAISSGASCTVAQNTTVQNIGFAASMLDGEGEVTAALDVERVAADGTKIRAAAEDSVPLFRQGASLSGTGGPGVAPTLEGVQSIASRAGADLSGIKVTINQDEDLLGRQLYGHTPDVGNITLYPDAFTNEETMAATLGHELNHVYQLRMFGPAMDTATGGLYESASYAVEQSYLDFFRMGG